METPLDVLSRAASAVETDEKNGKCLMENFVILAEGEDYNLAVTVHEFVIMHWHYGNKPNNFTNECNLQLYEMVLLCSLFTMHNN